MAGQPALSAPPPGTPIDIGADPARDLARDELSREIYRQAAPGPLATALRWLSRRLDDLLRLVDQASPGGRWGLVVIVLVLLVVGVVVWRRFGSPARTSRTPVDVLGATELTAADHRRRAAEHEAAGRHDEVVRERMRAIVRDLEERTVLAPRRGRTAGEAAREGGRALPTLADSLAEAAHRFDETVYGGRPADAEAAARMRAVDEQVAATRAVPTG